MIDRVPLGPAVARVHFLENATAIRRPSKLAGVITRRCVHIRLHIHSDDSARARGRDARSRSNAPIPLALPRLELTHARLAAIHTGTVKSHTQWLIRSSRVPRVESAEASDADSEDVVAEAAAAAVDAVMVTARVPGCRPPVWDAWYRPERSSP